MIKGVFMSLIEFKNVSRIYKVGDHEQKALDDINLKIEQGKFIVILGPSGAGKSTLLNLLGGLDSPTSGTILVENNDISKLDNNALADYRASTVGFVFQSYNLIPHQTVLNNVRLALTLSGISKRESMRRAKKVLKEEDKLTKGLVKTLLQQVLTTQNKLDAYPSIKKVLDDEIDKSITAGLIDYKAFEGGL